MMKRNALTTTRIAWVIKEAVLHGLCLTLG